MRIITTLIVLSLISCTQLFGFEQIGYFKVNPSKADKAISPLAMKVGFTGPPSANDFGVDWHPLDTLRSIEPGLPSYSMLESYWDIDANMLFAYFENSQGQIVKISVHKPNATFLESLNEKFHERLEKRVYIKSGDWLVESETKGITLDDLSKEQIQELINHVQSPIEGWVEFGGTNSQILLDLFNNNLVAYKSQLISNAKTAEEAQGIEMCTQLCDYMINATDFISLSIDCDPQAYEFVFNVNYKPQGDSAAAIYLNTSPIKEENALNTLSKENTVFYNYSNIDPSLGVELYNHVKKENPTLYDALITPCRMRIEDGNENIIKTVSESGVTILDMWEKTQGRTYLIGKILEDDLVYMTLTQLKDSNVASDEGFFASTLTTIKSWFGGSKEEMVVSPEQEKVYVFEQLNHQLGLDLSQKYYEYKGWQIASNSPKGIQYLKNWIDGCENCSAGSIGDSLKDDDLVAYSYGDFGAFFASKTVMDAIQSEFLKKFGKDYPELQVQLNDNPFLMSTVRGFVRNLFQDFDFAYKAKIKDGDTFQFTVSTRLSFLDKIDQIKNILQALDAVSGSKA